jgi:hypothetical protein
MTNMTTVIDNLIATDDSFLQRYVEAQSTADLIELYVALGKHPLWWRSFREKVDFRGGWFVANIDGRDGLPQRRAGFNGYVLERLRSIKDASTKQAAAAKEEAEQTYWEARGITTGVATVPAAYI